jgi:hypothetical protein
MARPVRFSRRVVTFVLIKLVKGKAREVHP